MKCETVKVKDSVSGYKVINKSDFDEKEHKLAAPADLKKAAPKQKMAK